MSTLNSRDAVAAFSHHRRSQSDAPAGFFDTGADVLLSQVPPVANRSQSDAPAGFFDTGADVLLSQEPHQQQHNLQQAPAHVRSVSLGSSASQFLQSLKLQDPAALQHNLQPHPHQQGDQQQLLDQTTPHAAAQDAAGDPALAAAAAAGQPPARSKRSHRSSGGGGSSGGRVSSSSGGGGQDAMQLDTASPEQQQQPSLLGFKPLPAVEEDGNFDSERDWDSDSDREGVGPNRRGSRGSSSSRRGGYNGRSESELMLLDPKRVKRILANRESAARSKERRMNYTAELEGKIEGLSVEADRLSSRLHSLNKQDAKLRASKNELEQQVECVQQQLVQVQSDNQALMATLLQLQAALGLPQGLPHDMLTGMQDNTTAAAGAGAGTAAGTCYEPPWQQMYQQQQHQQQQYTADCHKPPTSPTFGRKPRGRQTKQQQNAKQPQQPHIKQEPGAKPRSGHHHRKSSSSFGGGGGGDVELDLSDPAAAAAAPVAELPIKAVGFTTGAAAGAAAAASGVGAQSMYSAPLHDAAAAAAAAVNSAAAGPAAFAGCSLQGAHPAAYLQHDPVVAAAAGGGGGCVAAGTTACAAPTPAPTPKQHAWHTGLKGRSSSSGNISTHAGTTPLPDAAFAAMCAPHTAAHTAGNMSTAAMASAAGAAPGGGAGISISVQAAGPCSQPLPLLPHQQQPHHQQHHQQQLQPPPHLSLLGQLPAPGADAVMGDADEDELAMLGAFLEGEEDVVDTGDAAVLAAAAAGGAAGGAAGAGAGSGGIAATTAAAAVAAAAAAVTGAAGSAAIAKDQAAAAVGGRPSGCVLLRTSPALSEPAVGAEFSWHDEPSSGSVGGSVTHNHTPNLTPSGRLASDAGNGVSPAYAASWQQQQQQLYAAGNPMQGSVGGTVVSPQAAAAAAGGAGVSGPPGVGHCGWLSGPPSAAGSGSHVSPITPVSALAAAGRHASGVSAVTGRHSAGPSAAAATAGASQSWLQQQQQYQVHPGAAIGCAQHNVPDHSMAAAHPAAAAPHWNRPRHTRSASTGCVSGMGWQGGWGDQFGQPIGGAQVHAHDYQQQQQNFSDPSAVPAAAAAAAVAAPSGGGAHNQTPQGLSLPVPEGGALLTSLSSYTVTGAMMLSSSSNSSQDGSGGPHATGGWPRHRRSHSHAAAFMTHSFGGAGGSVHTAVHGTQQQQQWQEQQHLEESGGYGAMQ